MMAFPIVDSHVHLWKPARFSMPWLADLPPLQRAYELPDYWQSIEELPLEALVYVEVAVRPEETLQEARAIAELAQEEPRLQAIVAAAPLEQGAAARPHVEALTAISPLIKGVRRNLQDEAPDFCLQANFIQGVQMLAEYGLSFDVCIHHQQLPAVTMLIRQCPEVAFVLDHAGKPDIKGGLLHPWTEQIKELAALPNVHCKISGLVTEANPDHWETAHLAPFVQVLLETFGEDRVMFGGDWPVLLLVSSYRRWYASASELLGPLSPQGQRKCWAENARRFYRLTG